MPHFVSLMRLTQRGLDAIEKSPERAVLSRQRVETMGGRSECLFATMGPYDLVQIFEMPSDEAMMEYVMVARRDGYVDPVIMRAFNNDQWVKITENVQKRLKLAKEEKS